jgi:hypothetical protein
MRFDSRPERGEDFSAQILALPGVQLNRALLRNEGRP